MDAADIALIVIGVVGAIVIVSAGFLLDRRSQRIASANWMRNWTIRTRVLGDLFRRWQGPLRLEDRSSADVKNRKGATRRRKRSRNPPR